MMKDFNYLNQATIPTNYVHIIGHEIGLSLKALPKLLKFTQLRIDDLLKDDGLISPYDFIQIFNNGLYLTDKEYFGLDLGARLNPTVHGAMGFLMNSSPNLNIALKAIENFLPTRISFAQVELQYLPQSVLCKLKFSVELSAQTLQSMAEACMVVFVECAEFMIGKSLTEAHIYFQHEIPSYKERYSEFFKCDISYSNDFIGVEIPLSLCEIRNSSANNENYLLAKKQCEYLLQQISTPLHRYTYQVQKALLSASTCALKEEAIAQSLFMSKRTLARYLAKENTNFKDIKESILSQQARHYLLETNLSVEVIANLLNYHDSSNFRRAFKRWFHMTPSEYRTSTKI